jgi:hypothetical protein
MNLYGYSEENNREMGIEIQKKENYELYEEINKECQSIRDSAETIKKDFVIDVEEKLMISLNHP